MIPQLLATVWLTLMWSYIIKQFKKSGNDTPDSMAGATIIVGILVAILYHGNFYE